MQRTTPNGFVEMKNATSVFIGDDTIVILGNPDENVSEHNCDDMGCSSTGDHVIFRAKLDAQRIGG